MLGDNRHHIFCSYSWTKLPRCTGINSTYSVLTAKTRLPQVSYLNNKKILRCWAKLDTTYPIVAILFLYRSQTKLSTVSYTKIKTATLRGNRLHISCPYSRTRFPLVWYPTWRRNEVLPCWVIIDTKYRYSVLTADKTATLHGIPLHIFCSYSPTRLPPVSYPKNKTATLHEKNKISTGILPEGQNCHAGRESTSHILFYKQPNKVTAGILP